MSSTLGVIMLWLMALSVVMMPIMAIIVTFTHDAGRSKLVTHNGRSAIVPTIGNVITTAIVAIIAVVLCADAGLLVLSVFAPTGMAAGIYAILWTISAILSLCMCFSMNQI